MKNKLWQIIEVVIAGTAVSVTALAGGYSGGGDSCTQSIPKMQALVVESLRQQGQRTYPEVDFSTLKFFMKRATISLVPKTEVNGVETDARSFPESKTIELSRSRWCALGDEQKASVLFHEYLVVMELETTNHYEISSRFEPAQDLEKYVCNVTTYTDDCHLQLSIGRSGAWCGGLLDSKHVVTGYGPSADTALRDAISKTSGDVPCYRIAYDAEVTKGLNGARYFCAEPVTTSNSCSINR